MTKKQRALEIIERLKKEYPDAGCTLDYDDAWKLLVDLGTLTDEYEPEITIHTTAADKATGEKSIVAGKSVTIVDTYFRRSEKRYKVPA